MAVLIPIYLKLTSFYSIEVNAEWIMESVREFKAVFIKTLLLLPIYSPAKSPNSSITHFLPILYKYYLL